MHRVHRHPRLLLLTLAMFCLSFAVFNWGLQYKMSLCQHSEGPAKTSVAKLWTGSRYHKQADKSALPQPAHAPILVPLLILSFFAVFRQQRQLVAFHRWQRSAPVWKIQTAPVQNSYFFRPPPVHS